MPLLMRRRPLLRAAAVGGGAYYAGKRTAQSRQQAATQDQRLDDLEAQQSDSEQAPAPAPSAGITSEAMQKLQELAKLHEQEILTDDEFAQQKQRLLAS